MTLKDVSRSGNVSSTDGYFKVEGLKVAVITARDDAGTFLLRELQRLRASTQYLAPSSDPLPTDADAIYCDYEPSLAHRTPWLTGEGATALIVILPQAEMITAEALASTLPNAVLARPFTANAIMASLVMARMHFRYEQRLQSKVERLEDNLRSIRVVERAKMILKTSRGMSDDEAYKYIRSQSMARRLSVSSLAAAIVSSFELLGG